MKIQLWKLWSVIAGIVTLIATALIVILSIDDKRDLSNYTVDDAVTIRVIELFDSMGMKDEKQFRFGRISRGNAVGQLGFSSVLCFTLQNSKKEFLGVHRLFGFEQNEIRFSFGEQHPFETIVLSAALHENNDLYQSFFR